MSRYVSIATRMWHDEKFRELPGDARVLFIYLLTSPHNNMCGIYFLPALYACHDLQWDENKYNSTMEELRQKGLVVSDGDIILIKNFLKYNPIRGPKQAIGAANRLKEIPETNLLDCFIENLKLNTSSKDFETFINTYGKPFRKGIETPPIPDSGTGTGTDSDSGTGTEGGSPPEPPAPYEKIKELYNEICLSFPRLLVVSENRKTHVRARWRQYKYNFDIFRELFTKAEASDFLKGINDKDWKADFDWLINEANMTKTLEGKYDNKAGDSNGKAGQSDKRDMAGKYRDFVT